MKKVEKRARKLALRRRIRRHGEATGNGVLFHSFALHRLAVDRLHLLRAFLPTVERKMLAHALVGCVGRLSVR